MSAETYIYEKKPRKETYEKDVQKSPTKEPSKKKHSQKSLTHRVSEAFHTPTCQQRPICIKRDLQKRATKETYKRDFQKRPTRRNLRFALERFPKESNKKRPLYKT